MKAPFFTLCLAAAAVAQNGPAPATGGWKAVAVDHHFTCAVTKDERLYCWGDNEFGQLGNGTTTSSAVPVEVKDGPWKNVFAAWRTSFGLKDDGSLWGWGAFLGQDVSQRSALTPERLGESSDWESISMLRARVCGLKKDGTIWWEGEHGGQIGGDADWVQFSTGADHMCMVKRDSSLWCHQEAGGPYREGVRPIRKPRPERIGMDNDWRFVLAGDRNTCAVKTDGTRWCWGANPWHIGMEPPPREIVPEPVRADRHSDWRQLTRSCGMKADGTVWCWAEFGNDHAEFPATPVGNDSDWSTLDSSVKTPPRMYGRDHM
ncbi:MAG: hypothetical protein HY897_08970 [Deltaproteobacteria bacterium]|nr:hypothetical protein [Deltaproteobacteria bacterium]